MDVRRSAQHKLNIIVWLADSLRLIYRIAASVIQFIVMAMTAKTIIKMWIPSKRGDSHSLQKDSNLLFKFTC